MIMKYYNLLKIHSNRVLFYRQMKKSYLKFLSFMMNLEIKARYLLKLKNINNLLKKEKDLFSEYFQFYNKL